MTNHVIYVQDAHAHNLRNVSLTFSAREFVVLRGPSGSGKTSFAIDVVHAESRRRLLETLRSPGDASGALPLVEVDQIDHLPPTFAVRPGSEPAPPCAAMDVTDIGNTLRAVFLRGGQLIDPQTGAAVRRWNPHSVAQELARLPVGTSLTIGAPLPVPSDPSRLLAELLRAGFTRVRLGNGRMVRLDAIQKMPPGVAPELIVDRIRIRADNSTRIEEAIRTAWTASEGHTSVEVEGEASIRRYSASPVRENGHPWPLPHQRHLDATSVDGRCGACRGAGCETCEGTGDSEVARILHANGRSWTQITQTPVHDLLPWAKAHPSLPTLLARSLQAWVDLDLGHLTLRQPANTLGTGEWSRLLLARAVPLVDAPRVLVLDEVCSGLTGTSCERVMHVLMDLVARGVGVLAIDHNDALLDYAHREVAFGPGSGPHGGQVTYEGPPRRIPQNSADCSPAPTSGTWRLSHPRASLNIPIAKDRWTILTGPSGAGTTSLLRSVPQGPPVRVIENRAPTDRPNARSCLSTTAGIWGPIRELLTRTTEARTRGLAADAFTFNRASGWCPECEGIGGHVIQLGPLPPDWRPCTTCDGGRLHPDRNEIQWKGHGPADILRLDVDRALPLFVSHPKVGPRLRALEALGLGHIPLGRPTASLSGGERQRLATALTLVEAGAAARDGTPIWVAIDRVDAGLDSATAAKVADWLLDHSRKGITLVTVAHHPMMLSRADYVASLPEKRTLPTPNA